MKYALVTGSTKGIGRAIAEKLLANDYFVFLNYANDDKAGAAINQMFKDRYQNKFSLIKADLSNFEGLHLLTESIKSITNQLDCVVLNVGIIDRSTLNEITPDIWNKVMNTNVTIPFFLAKNIRPLMQKGGSILFMSSYVGTLPHSISAAYGISKAAVSHMAKSLVKEFAAYQVTVNAVSPGFVETDMQKNIPNSIRKSKESKVALGRFAEAEEIAELCYHMLHNQYINGAVYHIDGGYSYK